MIHSTFCSLICRKRWLNQRTLKDRQNRLVFANKKSKSNWRKSIYIWQIFCWCRCLQFCQIVFWIWTGLVLRFGRKLDCTKSRVFSALRESLQLGQGKWANFEGYNFNFWRDRASKSARDCRSCEMRYFWKVWTLREWALFEVLKFSLTFVCNEEWLMRRAKVQWQTLG